MENDPLAAYLDALARDGCYRVAQVLKTAPHETTEVVYFVGANAAELGPFVRKRISVEAAMGDAYRHLLAAQRAGRRFRHLPQVYDVHESDGLLVVVMEYVTGRTLRDEVYACDGSPALAARWFPLLCDGVMELHEQFPAPLIHRDLKPSNVLVSEEGLTIIDFGIARAFREGAEGDTARFGTRSYAPPEQFGYGQTDVRSDVYALGMLLYYLLTERDPSPAVATAGFVGPEVPDALRPVMARACAFDPAARYQSVRELKEAFEAAVAPSVVSTVAPLVPRAAEVLGPDSSGAPAGLEAALAVPGVDSSGASAGLEAAPAAPGTMMPAVSENLPAAVAAGVAAAPANRFAAQVREAFTTLSRTEVVGLAWDGLLLGAWVLFALVLLTVPFGALNEPYSMWPLWLVMAFYWASEFPLLTGALFALADVRVVRRMAPRMRLLRGFRLRVLGIGLMAAGVAAVVVVVMVAMALGLPT